MKLAEVIAQLEGLGSASTRKTLIRHGANEPVLGVAVSELKKLKKKIGTDHDLAMDLFETGIYDAQYLAGLVVDDSRMKKRELRHWVARSNCSAIAGTIVAWVAAESSVGEELAQKWVDAKNENAAQTGWMTFSSLVAIRSDEVLDLELLGQLLDRVEETIHEERNLVRYAMNGFVIAVGIHVGSLTARSIQVGKQIGSVTVDMGDTACAVPSVVEYIRKAEKRGAIGKKRKAARC